MPTRPTSTATPTAPEAPRAMTRREALAATAVCAACAAFPARALSALAPLAPAPVAGRFVLTYAAHPVLASVGGSVTVRVPGGVGDAEEIVVTRTGTAAAAAASAICPHQGCSVNPYDATRARIVCPCHGSEFDVTGRLLTGPARDALTPYPATLVADGVAVEIPGFVAADASEAPPLARLHAPAPDPSRGPVRLAFALAAPGHARLCVADALGRDVACLLDAPLAPGEHTATWTGEGAAPGLYTARLHVGSTLVATRALTRVR